MVRYCLEEEFWHTAGAVYYFEEIFDHSRSHALCIAVPTLPIFLSPDFSARAVKAGFIRKVYGILAIQLLFTVAGACTCMFSESIRASVLGTPSMLMVASIAPFGFLLGLYCYKDKHPVNLVLLGGFTLCMTYTVGVVCAAYYEGGYGLIVLQALILTASVFASLTTYVMVTKKDFSWMGGALFSGLIILIIWGFMVCRARP